MSNCSEVLYIGIINKIGQCIDDNIKNYVYIISLIKTIYCMDDHTIGKLMCGNNPMLTRWNDDSHTKFKFTSGNTSLIIDKHLFSNIKIPRTVIDKVYNGFNHPLKYNSNVIDQVNNCNSVAKIIKNYKKCNMIGRNAPIVCSDNLYEMLQIIATNSSVNYLMKFDKIDEFVVPAQIRCDKHKYSAYYISIGTFVGIYKQLKTSCLQLLANHSKKTYHITPIISFNHPPYIIYTSHISMSSSTSTNGNNLIYYQYRPNNSNMLSTTPQE